MTPDAPLHRAAARRLAAVGPPDPTLLARFAGGEQGAFAVLVQRHGPTVLGVCRRVLGPGPDADDAFQATFVVLARRAAHLRRPDQLGGWLYAVADRTARTASARRRRRLRREAPTHPLPDRPARPDAPSDVGPAVERELQRLPERLRAAVALCLVDGRSRTKAAALLGIPEGTLSSRLAEGRKRLADRLAGVGLAAAAPLVVPAGLQAAAVRAAGGGVTGSVSSLATGVSKAMNRTVWVAWAVGLGAVGLGVTAVAGPAGRPAPAAAATRPADNLLRNGGCEDGDKSPAHWEEGAAIDGVEYIWDRAAGQKGKRSLCLHKTASRYFPVAQWHQTVDRSGDLPGVRVSAQVKAEGVTKATLDVQFLDATGDAVGHKWAAYIGAKEANDPPATHDWKEYAGRVDVPASTKKLLIGLQLYGPGKVWFDEVRAEAVK